MLTSQQLDIIRKNSRDEAAFHEIINALKPSIEKRDKEKRDNRLQMLEAAFSFIPVGITVHDADGTIVAYNDRALEILHLSPDVPEELDPRFSTWDVIYPDGSPVEMFDLPGGKALMTGQPSGGELFKVNLVDGEQIWVQAYAVPLFQGENPHPSGVVASLLDVTRWQEAEATAREQGELLQQLAENIQEVFYIRDYPSQELRYVSPAYEQVWGQPIATILNDPESFVTYIHPDDVESFQEDFRNQRPNGHPLETRYRIVREDGDIRWIRDRAFPIHDEQAKIIRWAGVAEDITSQVKHAQFLQQLNDQLEARILERTVELEAANQELRELSLVKDKFVANVSHELRTPLTNLRLYIHLLNKHPEKGAKYLDVLQREGERLEGIVEHLLRISRLTLRVEEMALELISLDDLIGEFVEDRRQMAIDRGLQVIFSSQQPLTYLALVDRRLFGHALSALFTNAVNYTPAGGRLGVRVYEAKQHSRFWCVVEVTDTGMGFSAEEEHRLFERFYRGDAARTFNLPGTGIGLSIAQEIIERHGGRITASSAGRHQGATFEIWLPIDGAPLD